MYRFTTPVLEFDTNIDLRNAKVFLTFSQGGEPVVELTEADLDITENTIVARLTQYETGDFAAGQVEVQLRYVLENGIADASDPAQILVKDVMKEGVIEWS